ncbi:hypothetical protein BBP40_003444 [Aspergillus hancockii]|nr:hypothetical protein BBP40_003444 [Aspergillus hancockii]
MSDMQMSRKLHIDYTLAAVEAFDQVLASRAGKLGKFRFVYCSGGAAERDQTKPLWFAQETRRIRVEVENQLIAYGQGHSNTIETYILRPAMVLSREMSIRSLVSGLGPSIKMDPLAGVVVDIALRGHSEQILENWMISK